MSLVLGDPRHGTNNGYNNYGCRCDDCRAAHTSYCRDKKLASYRADLCSCGKEKRVLSDLCRECYDEARRASHGTESCYTSGCRCDECRSAATELRRERRLNGQVRKHGTSAGYANGCRCGDCRAGRRAYRAMRRASVTPPVTSTDADLSEPDKTGKPSKQAESEPV